MAWSCISFLQQALLEHVPTTNRAEEKYLETFLLQPTPPLFPTPTPQDFPRTLWTHRPNEKSEKPGATKDDDLATTWRQFQEMSDYLAPTLKTVCDDHRISTWHGVSQIQGNSRSSGVPQKTGSVNALDDEDSYDPCQTTRKMNFRIQQ